MNGVDDLMKQLERLEKSTEEIAEKMVDSGKQILEKNVTKNVQTAANRGYATGELAESIKAGKTSHNEHGCYSVIRPTGKDSKGVRNGEKLAYLEYGVPGKQAPHPVLTKSVNESETDCLKEMQRIFDRETGAGS
jgi:HK97 gp10 family phage protein